MTALLFGTLGKYLALGAVIATVLATAWRAAFKAGKNSEIAKDAKANDNALDKLNQANAARSAAAASGMSDDGFKRD